MIIISLTLHQATRTNGTNRTKSCCGCGRRCGSSMTKGGGAFSSSSQAPHASLWMVLTQVSIPSLLSLPFLFSSFFFLPFHLSSFYFPRPSFLILLLTLSSRFHNLNRITFSLFCSLSNPIFSLSSIVLRIYCM